MKKVFGLLAFAFAIAVVAIAQPGGSPPTGPNPGGPTPLGATTLPVDGGISLLIAAGSAFGMRRLKAKKAAAAEQAA